MLRHLYWRARRVFSQPWPMVWRSVCLASRDIIVNVIIGASRDKLSAIRNRSYLKSKGITAYPPTSLRQRVGGSASADVFVNVGRRSIKAINAALHRQSRDISTFKTVLDFGCGCGRSLLWLDGGAEIHGADIDAEAIRWCRENLPRGHFSVNEALPPLDYPGDKFDLIFGISILTHFNEEYQFKWLEELARVTKPGGMVVLTLHGDFVAQDLKPDLIAQLDSHGFLFVADDFWKEHFPGWYQTAFHRRDYVMVHFAQFFNVVDYIPRGMNGHQDMVVLQKRD